MKSIQCSFFVVALLSFAACESTLSDPVNVETTPVARENDQEYEINHTIVLTYPYKTLQTKAENETISTEAPISAPITSTVSISDTSTAISDTSTAITITLETTPTTTTVNKLQELTNFFNFNISDTLLNALNLTDDDIDSQAGPQFHSQEEYELVKKEIENLLNMTFAVVSSNEATTVTTTTRPDETTRVSSYATGIFSRDGTKSNAPRPDLMSLVSLDRLINFVLEHKKKNELLSSNTTSTSTKFNSASTPRSDTTGAEFVLSVGKDQTRESLILSTIVVSTATKHGLTTTRRPVSLFSLHTRRATTSDQSKTTISSLSFNLFEFSDQSFQTNKNINLNGKNFTILNVTDLKSEGFDAFHYIGLHNYAQEIILLSTAFATMLLSLCFLVFILWFCHFTVMRDKKLESASRAMARDKMIEKSMRESESNLIAGGVKASRSNRQMDPILKTAVTSGQIYVRDEGAAAEMFVMQSLPPSYQKKVTIDQEKVRKSPNETMNRTKEAQVQTTATTATTTNQEDLPRVLKINNYSSPNVATASTGPKPSRSRDQEIKIENCDSNYYHQYDNLELSNTVAKQQRKPVTGNGPSLVGRSNEAFEEDDDSNIKMQHQLSNSSPKSLPPAQTHFVKHFSQKYTEPAAVYARINNNCAGRVDKNFSLRSQPRLNRKQIEKEFYEYTVECRRKLNELFAESLSSDSTPRSSLDVPISHLSSSAQNLTSTATLAGLGGKKMVTYSNNFNMLKRARCNFSNENVYNNNNNNNSNANAYACFTNGNASSDPTPTIRRKKIDNEQVWHI